MANIQIIQGNFKKKLKNLYRQGYHYKKASVIVMGIGPNSPIQPDLFDYNAEQFEKMKRLYASLTESI